MSYLYRIFRATEWKNKQRILDLIEPTPGGRLLDLGCNDGAFTQELARKAMVAEVHGVEFVDSLANEAGRRGVIVSRQDLNEGLPYEDGVFDVVHSNQVIEHLVRTDQFLREIRRVLKPTGYAVISTNNLASWHNLFSLLLGLQPMPSHVSDEVIVGNPLDPRYRQIHPEKGFTHLRIFAYQGLGDLARLHGFKVDRLITAGYYPFPPVLSDFLCRLDPRHGAFLIARINPLVPSHLVRSTEETDYAIAH